MYDFFLYQAWGKRSLTSKQNSVLTASENQKLGIPKRWLYLEVWKSHVIADLFLKRLSDKH